MAAGGQCHLADVVEVFLVVFARPGMFNGFPGDEQPQDVEPPGPQAAQVFVGLVKRERPADERDVAVVEESLAQPGGAVGPQGNLAAAAQVDPPQKQRPTVLVEEAGSVDADHAHTS
jgi:hypothetical protein